MKVITKMELQPGMVLGEDIYQHGNLIYPADTKVDSRIIEKLNRYSLLCVTIKEDIDFATTHYEKIRFNENFRTFERVHASVLMRYKEAMFDFLRTGNKVSDDFLIELYNELYSLLPNNTTLLDYLYNLVPNEDELTFTQCLNSALLGGTFADWISMNAEAKKNLILSGFYYDIGKLRLPTALLWKPGRLTAQEIEEIRKHTVLGYELVQRLNLNDHIKNAVLMHHERMDGSGYPYGFAGNRIDLYARYIAIIDSYTAMASPRAYRSAFTPLQILGIFEQNLEKYDIELLMPLMKRIADAQIGSTVQLNDDSMWEVLIIHPNRFSRPILRNKNNVILDLIDHPELEIMKNL